MITSFHVTHCPLILSHFFTFSFSPSGQGLLSQSALQLNNQDAYAAAGYHSNQGLALGESITGRSGQVGGAVHIYNQVHTDLYFCTLDQRPSPSMLSLSSSLLYLYLLPSCISIFLHPSASLSFLSLFTFTFTHFVCPLSCLLPPDLPSNSIFPFLLLLTCCLTPFLHTLSSLGDIQPCSCPLGGNRLSLPVPERLICPAGPWQRLPHAH